MTSVRPSLGIPNSSPDTRHSPLGSRHSSPGTRHPSPGSRPSNLELRTSNLAPRTVLITGGAGFIGSHTVEALISRGDTVVAVDSFNRFYSPKQKENNLSQVKNHKNFYLYKVDIRDEAELKEVFSKHYFDCVVHLAAMAGVRPSIENPRLYADVNVVGTTNILENVRTSGVKQFVFASSSSVYGNRQTGPFKETDPTDDQVSPYGATKKAGELLCHTYAHLYKIKTTILRFFTVYGPRNRPDMACYSFTDAIMKDRPIMRFGPGDTGRDYTYVADTVSGILSAIDHPFDFEIINLGNSTPVKLNDLIKTIEKVTGKKANVNELPLQPGDVDLTFADTTKAKKLLGYEPQTKLHQGVHNLFDWYQAASQ
jgi:UDP-glucuronate 4-epimerase